MVNLSKAAYTIRELIKDDDLDIWFKGDNISFNIFDKSIKTDGSSYFTSTDKNSDIKQEVTIKDVYELYHYVIVQVTKNIGFKSHRDLTMRLENLELKDYEHVLRLSKEWKVSAEEVLDEITFTTGSPEQVHLITTAAAKFIQSIAGQNRKRIIEECITRGEKNYQSAL